jgi:hypothetical protein
MSTRDETYEWEQAKSRYIEKHHKFRKTNTYRATKANNNKITKAFNNNRCNIFIKINERENILSELSIDESDIDSGFDRSIIKYHRLNGYNKESYGFKIDKGKNWTIEDYLEEECLSNREKYDEDDLFTIEKSKKKANFNHKEYKVYKNSISEKSDANINDYLDKRNTATNVSSKPRKIENQIKIREPKTKPKFKPKNDSTSEFNCFNKEEVASIVFVNPINEPKKLNKCSSKQFNTCSSRKRILKIDGEEVFAYKNKAKEIKKTIHVKKRRETSSSSQDYSVTEINNLKSDGLIFYHKFINNLLFNIKDISKDGLVILHPLINIEPTIQKRSSVEKIISRDLYQKIDINKPVLDYEIIERQNCFICFANDPNLQYITLKSCDHTACRDCWITYVEVSVNQFKSVDSTYGKQLTCPFNKCNSILSYEFLKSIVDEKIVESYVQYHCDLVINNSNKYIECGNRCENLIVVNSSKANVSVCTCGYAVCNHCRGEAHHSFSCYQYNHYRNEFNDLLYNGDMIMGKRCPKCRAFIEKDGGCSHMKCFCGTQFCWRCLTVYSENTAKRHGVCLEKSSQIFITEGESVSAYIKCKSKCIELITFHNESIEQFIRDFKKSLISGIIKSSGCEDFKKALIKCFILSSYKIHIKNENIYFEFIDSLVMNILRFIQNSLRIFELACGAHHYNLKNGIKNKHLMNYVDKAILTYNSFYKIFSKELNLFSLIKLLYIYLKIKRLLFNLNSSF